MKSFLPDQLVLCFTLVTELIIYIVMGYRLYRIGTWSCLSLIFSQSMERL